MALKFSLLISSLIFINACKFNDKPTWHYTPETDKAKEQLFDITIGKANVLVCKGGTKIHISANSFIGSLSNFKLKVKEALTISDMLAF